MVLRYDGAMSGDTSVLTQVDDCFSSSCKYFLQPWLLFDHIYVTNVGIQGKECS